MFTRELCGGQRTLLGVRSRSRTHAVPEEAARFRDLFDRHAPAVFNFCARRTADLSLADDLTSIVFLEAWKHRDRTELDDMDNPLPWLLGVANNVVRNDLRARIRYRAALRRLPDFPSVASGEDQAVARADAERAFSAALSALRSLAKTEQDVVVMVLWSGLTYEEAASALGIPAGTVRSRLSRARARLQSNQPPAVAALLKETL